MAMGENALPDLVRRRRKARRIAWALASFVVALYLFGFFIQRG
jgi:hypothetical protein